MPASAPIGGYRVPCDPRAVTVCHEAARLGRPSQDPSRIELLEWFAGALGEVNVMRDLGVAAVARRAAAEPRMPDGATPFAVEGLVLELLALAAPAAEDRCHRQGRPRLPALLVIGSLTYTTVPRRPSSRPARRHIRVSGLTGRSTT